MRFSRLILAVGLLCAAWLPANAQSSNANVVASCGSVTYDQLLSRPLTQDPTGKLCVNATVSATVGGFQPNGAYGTLTATAASSASTALPTGATVRITNLGASAIVSCTFATGAATGLVSNLTIPPLSSVSRVVGTFDHIACIDQTGSTGSNLVVLEGGSGLGNDSGGGGGGSGGATNVTQVGGVNVPTGGGLQSGALPVDASTASQLHADLTAPVVAGEFHIGEIASNQIKVQVAQTVTAASAYASGNAIGGLMTIAGATRVSGAAGAAGTGGILTGMMMNAKSLQNTQVDVVFFDANPSGSTCTDKTAFSLATADFDKVVGYLTVPGTAANGAGWVAGTVGSVGVATYYPMTYDLASSTSLFACAITRGTPTYTATTDVSFKFNILRN